METFDKDSSLEEIRKAQADIAGEMDNTNLTQTEQRSLEKASLYLRNMERSLVNSLEKQLIDDLKNETSSLTLLIAEMKKTTDKLFRVVEILDKVVKNAVQIINILELVR